MNKNQLRRLHRQLGKIDDSFRGGDAITSIPIGLNIRDRMRSSVLMAEALRNYRARERELLATTSLKDLIK